MARFEAEARDPLFFMHIPKTAGTSMRLFLRNQYQPHHICPAVGWRDVPAIAADLRRYRLVQGHFQFNLLEALAPSTKILTILRDPVARTISALRHLRRDPTFHPMHAAARDKTLGQLVRDPGIMAQQRNVQAAHLCASAPPERVLDLLNTAPDADPVSLETRPDRQRALDRLERIDFLGLVEDLAAAADELSAAMDFHPAAWLPLMNGAPDEPAALSEAEIAILCDYNQIDLELYARAEKIITQRRFEAAMRRLLANGVYRTPQGGFEIDLLGIMPGSGWYAPEGHDGRHWRWTGPDRRFSLELPMRPNGAYQGRLHFVTRRDAAPALSVELNGAAIPLDVSLTGGGWLGSFEIPRGALHATGGLCRLVFDTQTAEVSGSGDDLRRLGIAVNRIAFVCRD